MIEMHWSTALLLLIVCAAAVYGLVRLSHRRIDRDWPSKGEYGP